MKEEGILDIIKGLVFYLSFILIELFMIVSSILLIYTYFINGNDLSSILILSFMGFLHKIGASIDTNKYEKEIYVIKVIITANFLILLENVEVVSLWNLLLPYCLVIILLIYSYLKERK